MKPHVQNILRRGGGQKRRTQRGKVQIRITGQRRGFRPVVIAHKQQRPALGIGSGKVGMAQRVHRPVHARCLAIPDREHPIDARARKSSHHLRTPCRRRGEILVHTRLKMDVMRLQRGLRPPQVHVIGADRRPAIARDIPAGIQSRGDVALALLDRQPHQRLHAGHIDPAFLLRQTILQTHLKALGRQMLCHDVILSGLVRTVLRIS